MGIALTVGNAVFGWTTPIIAGALAMIVSLVVCPVVSLLAPAPDRSTVAHAFAICDEAAGSNGGLGSAADGR